MPPGQAAPQQAEENSFRDEENDDRPQKKEFLKRKSTKGPVAVPTKKYNYYVDNFEGVPDAKKTKETRPGSSQLPERVALQKTEEHHTAFSKQQSVDSHPSSNPRSVSPMLEHVASTSERFSESHARNSMNET
jgi:hypothetical protein